VAWPKHKDEIPDLSPLNLRILVVDDNPIHLEIMQALLAQLKLDADYAIDGYDAVHKVANAEKPYDIVFMDIVMPSMNGIDAARKIRSLNSGQLVNITALTSNSSPEDRSQCYQAGMNSFIAKPVTLNLLVESIQSSPKILASYN
jgi:CheY-like chemotaxis protein